MMKPPLLVVLAITNPPPFVVVAALCPEVVDAVAVATELPPGGIVPPVMTPVIVPVHTAPLGQQAT